jgi:catechol 2,3-dioxygenase-like lactoylglutathione lyase family enzyme
MPNYSGVLLAVNDLTASRAFYEQLLGQKVKFDFGVDVAFEGGLTIHLGSHFQNLLGEAVCYPITQKANNGELFFEEENIKTLQSRLKAAGLEFIHEIQEQPWGQRVLRVYDPDGYIVEIGEPMETVVKRLHEQGLSTEVICQKTSMPHEFIEQVIKNI